MYTLLRDLNNPNLHAIVHLPTFSWGPCEDGTNWFDSPAKALDVAFNSNQPFYTEDQTDEDLHFQQFSSVEDYCIALQTHPNYVSPEVVCHFESPDNFFEQFPELLL